LYVRDEEAKAEKEARRLVDLGEKAGVATKFTLHHTTKRPAQTILDAAARFKTEMICVCSKTTGAASFILGSVTRDLLEDSSLPVFVIPTERVT
jgi:nucleotide-binding universal stress UspA family protein